MGTGAAWERAGTQHLVLPTGNTVEPKNLSRRRGERRKEFQRHSVVGTVACACLAGRPLRQRVHARRERRLPAGTSAWMSRKTRHGENADIPRPDSGEVL